MTNPSTAITLRPTATPQVWQMIKDMAPEIFNSRLFKVTSKEAAAAIMLKAFELGLPFTAGFEFIQVVEGKPELSPRGALALLHSSPLIVEIRVTRLVNTVGGFVGFECFMKRTNGFSYTAKYTLEDAAKAGLVKPNSNWQKYPENMCQWRAIGFCADVVAPDVTAGMTGLMKMPEHYGVGLDEGGNVIEGEVKATPVTVDEKALEEKWFGPDPKASAETIVKNPVQSMEVPFVRHTLASLADAYGADAVMAANDGKIPATDDEVAAVAAKLGGTK